MWKRVWSPPLGARLRSIQVAVRHSVANRRGGSTARTRVRRVADRFGQVSESPPLFPMIESCQVPQDVESKARTSMITGYVSIRSVSRRRVNALSVCPARLWICDTEFAPPEQPEQRM